MTAPKPPRRPPIPPGRSSGSGESDVASLRAKLAAEIRRRDVFARQAAKIKKVAARTFGSSRARGR